MKGGVSFHGQDDERTTAIGLARFAYEYIDAARLVDEHQNSSRIEFISTVPAYYLAKHGIELTLKAFLRQKNISIKDLSSARKYGHDLKACYRKAKELGLKNIFKMRADDMRALLMLIELDDKHALRYIRTGPRRFPSWAIVESFAVRLHQAVAPHIGYETFNVSFGKHE